MGLGKYRVYKEKTQDDGLEVFENLVATFSPDFYNRHTIQVWDISATAEVIIDKWKGATLTDRTLHEITIVNNSNSAKKATFNSIYILADSQETVINAVTLGAKGSAHFYATASLVNGNLLLTLRKGSQDNRKL